MDVQGMRDVLSSTETTEARFALYAEELEEFFASHKLHCGFPDDIVALAETLHAPGFFHEEMSSMIRSILYREKGTVPRTQILDLVVTTIGGLHIDRSAQEFHEPIRKIFDFIGGVLRPTRRPVTDDEQETPRPGAQTGAQPTVHFHTKSTVPTDLQSADHTEHLPTSSPDPANQLEPALESDRKLATPFQPTRNLYSRATAASTDPATPDDLTSFAGPIAPDSDAPETRAELPTHQAPALSRLSEPSEHIEPASAASAFHDPSQPIRTFAIPIPPLQFSPRRRSSYYWILGSGLLLFLLIAVFLLHLPTASSTHQVSRALPGSVPPTMTLSAPAQRYPSQSNSPQPDTSLSTLQPGRHDSANKPNTSELSSSALSSHASDRSISPFSGTPKPSADKTHQAEAAGSSGSSASTSQAHSSPSAFPPTSSYPPESRTIRYPRTTTSKGQGTLTVSSGVMASNLISAPPPKYPKFASFTHTQGQVILQAVVSRSGNVIDTRVLSGHRILRGAATQAVRRWQYRPYLVNGRPTDVATIVTVDFRLPH